LPGFVYESERYSQGIDHLRGTVINTGQRPRFFGIDYVISSSRSFCGTRPKGKEAPSVKTNHTVKISKIANTTWPRARFRVFCAGIMKSRFLVFELKQTLVISFPASVSR
jgi:hypothetical protein